MLIFLLLITEAYIPIDVQNTITGLNYVLFPYGLIPFNKNKSVNSFIQNFNFSLSNSIYEPLNLKSNSSVFNTYSLFILVFTIAFLHISALCLMKKLSDWINYSGRCSWWVNIPKWIINKVYTVFDAVQSPCKFDKFLVVGYFIDQNFVLKILVLEITSRKNFLILLFIRYDTAIIKQLSSYFFWKNYPHQLAFASYQWS